MKKYAYYLPQFHEIPENNEWWGQGFTEWVNVKKATPLYKSHEQPKHPLNNNYYYLDDCNTLMWQANLAKEYNIEGMIFYHYYFEGRKLLEKPAEILLNNENIPINYFFCWANHSWYRSWEGSKTLLLEQTYGIEKDWESHFKYLLPFFLDSRYEKKNNRPLFMIFKSDFEEKNKYLEYLDKKCKENGFDGLCAIEIIEKYDSKSIANFINCKSDCTQFIHLREPAASLELLRSKPVNYIARLRNKIGKHMIKLGYNYIEKYDGNQLFKYLARVQLNDSKFIRGLCFEWDNTPRHQYRGYIISPPSKEKFICYMNSIKGSEYIFINAWNEWCEGMMLEPTIENGYKYLEWIKEWSIENDNRINGI